MKECWSFQCYLPLEAVWIQIGLLGELDLSEKAKNCLVAERQGKDLKQE